MGTMGFWGILLLFVFFCIISAGINLIEKVITAKLMKVQINQSVDAVFTGVIRAMMKHRIDMKTVFGKEVHRNDDMPNL